MIEKVTDAKSAKEYYKSYLKRKYTKLTKRSKIITQQPKTMENPNRVVLNQLLKNIIKVIKEHQKTSHKLSKTIREAEKVSKVVVKL